MSKLNKKKDNRVNALLGFNLILGSSVNLKPLSEKIKISLDSCGFEGSLQDIQTYSCKGKLKFITYGLHNGNINKYAKETIKLLNNNDNFSFIRCETLNLEHGSCASYSVLKEYSRSITINPFKEGYKIIKDLDLFSYICRYYMPLKDLLTDMQDTYGRNYMYGEFCFDHYKVCKLKGEPITIF